MKKYKKITSSIILTILLLSIIWFLTKTLFLTNYYDNWTNDAYTVLEIYDGDTIRVQGKFEPFKVRYIGINTPETEKPGQVGQCFANEANNRNIELLKNMKVYLESDQENKDKYDRELRYVYIKENNELVMINYILIKEGYAKVLKIAPNIKNAQSFSELEKEAKSKKNGLWGKC